MSNKAIIQAASDALSVQSAVNLSGVVHAYARAMSAISAAYPDKGTDWRNGHPIAFLFAIAVNHMTQAGGIASMDKYGEASDQCRALRAGEAIDY